MTPKQRSVCLFVLWGAFAVAMLVILHMLPLPDDAKATATLVLDVCALTGTWLITRVRTLAPQDA
ncbi:MAG: hypothetical protein IT320_17470 [Anaerolineae bacterium]|nr:hypothetical protein [Anaerolineae bacterium]